MKEVHVSNVPYGATEADLKAFLESVTSPGAVCSCELRRDSFQTKHKGFGFVTFAEAEVAEHVGHLATLSPFHLKFQGRSLRINVSKRQLKHNPEHSDLRLVGSALSMGCLTGDTFHSLWSTRDDVEIEFDFRERKFNLKVDGASKLDFGNLITRTTSYRLEFRFRYIFEIHHTKIAGSSSKGPILLIELWYPPHVYRQDSVAANSFDFLLNSDLFSTQPQPWARTIDFTEHKSIGQSFAYLLEFPQSIPQSDLSKVLSCLEDYQLVTAKARLLHLKTGRSYAETVSDVLVPLVKWPAQFRSTFRVKLFLDYLVQVGNLSGPSLSTKFFQLLAGAPEEAAMWVLESLAETSIMMSSNPEDWLEAELETIRSGRVRVPTSTSVRPDNGLIWVYRVAVSPTKIHCIGREVEVSNRVTREYMDDVDNFLRVSFIEEDCSNLNSLALSDPGNRNLPSDVYNRIMRVLKDGIWLHGKRFEFLAFSASQLRDHSVWMFAETGNSSASSIREWMGNFLGIRNVAKCAARMGQCFSSTTKTLPVESWEVDYVDDIRTDDGKYCFSDGIGKISFAFATKVARKCGCKGAVPSAFQIRYRGYKGVVAVSHDSDQKLELRDSMFKFESEHPDLEVISWSKRLPCFLNRQIITLLSTLGISDHVFERLQDLVLLSLNRVLSDVSVALETLQMTSSGATHETAVDMLKAGYHPTGEPYLLSLLQAFRAFQLLQLRTKSRILVSKGRTMMGCLDEIGVLDYGEVFLQVSSFPGTRNFINDGLEYDDDGLCVVEGPVVVAKNPCLHPGDVRVLYAVDAPELRHMVDCVVFPQRGSRPHPNECSGSDLDGDLYFVTWDQSLVPVRSDEPMDYDPPEAILLPRPVNIEDIQAFFADFMKSDTLGLIANAHVVHADIERDMARDSKCLELAKLFTMAVDFPKTGVPAVMRQELRATTYPDFMEKEDKVSYRSERVTGKLFRAVLGEARDKKNLITTVTRSSLVKSFDKELIWHGFEEYIQEAKMLKSWYDAVLVGVLNQYGIKTEAEALSGNILPLSKYYVKGQNEVRERISLAMRSLRSDARRWFKQDWDDASNAHSGEPRSGLDEREAFAKASAWYHVTYHESYLVHPKDGKSHQYLLSFPWAVHDTLLALKKRNRRRNS